MGIANTAENHGLKWNDLDGAGAFEPENGEPPWRRWILYLDFNGDGVLNNPISDLSACDPSVIEPYSLTDQNGEYRFAALEPDTYRVAKVIQDNWQQTFPTGGPHVVDLAEGPILENLNFGNCVPGDRDVDFTDFSVLAANLTGTLPPGTGGKTHQQGDFDGDGDIFGDFSVLTDGTGSANFDVPVVNSGTFDLHAGTSNFLRSYTQMAGTLSLAGGNIGATKHATYRAGCSGAPVGSGPM